MKGSKKIYVESAKLKKLREYTNHFNNSIADVKYKFAIWESMNNKKLHSRIQEKNCLSTFEKIRQTLLLSLTLDIANLARDNDKRSLSLITIMALVEDTNIQHELQKLRKDSKPNVIFFSEKPPLEYENMLCADEVEKRLNYFTDNLNTLLEKYSVFSSSPKIKQFWTVRSKILAHIDVYDKNGDLTLFSSSPTDIDISCNDTKLLISDLEEFNRLLYAVVECSSLTWDHFESGVKHLISEFWKHF